jgi:uncharacterized surface anchored protein
MSFAHRGLWSVILLISCAATLVAAANRSLSGTVNDSSGAVIAGATMQLRSADGSAQRTAHSDTNGSFTISGLPAGNSQG